MTTSSVPILDDDQAFRRELRRLLEDAHRPGIDLGRHWACRTDAGPGWAAEIARVEPADFEA